MKILLLNLPFIFDRKSDIILSHCLGIFQIASFLRENNYEVSILDALQEGIDKSEKYNKNYYRVGLSDEEIIEKISPDIDLIGISIPFSHLAKSAHNLIDKIKTKYSDIPIVIGGVYPSSQPELAVKSRADYIVLGEGEEPMLDLVNFLSKKTEELPHSIIQKESDLIHAKNHFTKDINRFPLPARDLVDFNKYLDRSPRNVRGWKSASIITSKGCPFDCEFCAVHSVCGYKWRPFTTQIVLDEINYLVDNYQVNNIEIEDDNFTINQTRVEEILHGIIEINKNKQFLSWQALNGLRIDTLNEDLIRLFKESNCRHLNIALEHGDQDMLNIIQKKLNLEKVVEIVGLLKKYEIDSHVFTIYGYPGETKERFENALNFYSKLKKIAPNVIFKFFIAQPYPNTKLFKRCVQEGYLPQDMFSDVSKISNFSTSNKIWITTPDFDKNEIMRRKNRLRKTLYTPKEYLMQIVREKLPDVIVDKLYSMYHKLAKGKINAA
ncbi:MAG TPA: radical SAM protein [Prolixibacteraceae bacterium]|nr:radical SAM protein [Prolixibacteraceae bacterium]